MPVIPTYERQRHCAFKANLGYTVLVSKTKLCKDLGFRGSKVRKQEKELPVGWRHCRGQTPRQIQTSSCSECSTGRDLVPDAVQLMTLARGDEKSDTFLP